MDSAVADIPILPTKVHNEFHCPLSKVYGFLYQDSIIQFISSENLGMGDQAHVSDLKSKKSSYVKMKNFPERLQPDDYSTSWVDPQTLFIHGCYKNWVQVTKGSRPVPQWYAESGYLDLSNFAENKELVYKPFESKNPGPILTGHTACVSQNKVFIFGGRDNKAKVVLSQLNILDLSTGEWTTESFESSVSSGLAPRGRENHNAEIIGSYMYVFGGTVPDDFWRLNLETLEWKQFSFKLPDQVGNIIKKSHSVGNTILCFAKNERNQTTKYLLAIKVKEDEIKLEVKKMGEQISFTRPPQTLAIYNNEIVHCWKYHLHTSPLEEVISLEDQNEPIATDLKSQMREYFEKRPHPDVIFKCGDQEIPAHKSVISVRCPFLGDLFLEQEGKPIELKDISADAFILLLEFIYCNEIRGLRKKNGEILEDLLVAADTLKLPGAIEMAQKCLVEGLTVENFVKREKILRGLAFQECKDLEKGIVNFILNNLEAAFKRDDILEVHKDIFYQALKNKK